MEATEQPASSGSDMESRISALFEAPESEAAQEPQEQEEPAEAQADDAEQDESADEPSTEAGLVEVELDDGEKYRVPQKLAEAVERHADYTRKTQSLAVERKAVEDRAYFVQAQEAINTALQSDYAEYRALEHQQKQFEALDWSALYNADPGQAMRLRDQRDDLGRQLQAKSQEINGKVQRARTMLETHADKQWALAVDAAKSRIGKLTPEDDQAMAREVARAGYDQRTTKMKLSDPNVLTWLHKAIKYDALQKGKTAAVETAQKAPPVVKPGAVNQMPQQVKQSLEFRKQMKSATTSADKALLIERRLAAKFK